MNEARILELNDIALAYADGHEDAWKMYPLKLAELVAADCISVCNMVKVDNMSSASDNDGRHSDFAFGKILACEQIHANIDSHFTPPK